MTLPNEPVRETVGPVVGFACARAVRGGVSGLLVEQNAYHALRLAHRGYVLVAGHVTLQGSGADLLASPQVRSAYLEGART